MILIGSGGIGIARDVQPVAPPLFAIARRGKQAVDKLRERVRRFVGDKGPLSPPRWVEGPFKIERRTPDQSQPSTQASRASVLFRSAWQGSERRSAKGLKSQGVLDRLERPENSVWPWV